MGMELIRIEKFLTIHKKLAGTVHTNICIVLAGVSALPHAGDAMF